MHDIHLAPQILFHLGFLSVSNSILTTWIVMAVIIVLMVLATRHVTLIPGKIQNLVEWVIEGLLDLIEQVTQDRIKAMRFLPFIATFFIFILLLNWMGLVPGVGSLFWGDPHAGITILRPANTDLNTTLALAIISVLGTQIVGIATIGFWKHIGHFLSFRNPIDFFVSMLHLIGEVAKILSFSFRLFGNMFAGEVLLIVITFLIPYIAPVPFYGLELFVGFIQALVFTMLTLVFMTVATSHTHDDITSH